MLWLAGLGFLIFLLIVLRGLWNEAGLDASSAARSRSAGGGGVGVTSQRGGKMRQDGEDYQAWASADLARMERALLGKTHPVNRHFLFLGVCEQTYRRRGEPAMRASFLHYARAHVAEFRTLVPALKREFDGILPRVPTFQKLATALAADGAFEEALEVCRLALALGLDDNTEGGFEGRMARIEKQRAKAAKLVSR